MLHEKVVCRAPPSKRDWPASANSPARQGRWLASLVAPFLWWSSAIARPSIWREGFMKRAPDRRRRRAQF